MVDLGASRVGEGKPEGPEFEEEMRRNPCGCGRHQA